MLRVWYKTMGLIEVNPFIVIACILGALVLVIVVTNFLRMYMDCRLRNQVRAYITEAEEHDIDQNEKRVRFAEDV